MLGKASGWALESAGISAVETGDWILYEWEEE